ncbi:hypothetical protein CRENBAI_003785 [Crenichthys baileyi]|uniref:Uncharacterized protein n=1 Tax=Crenichthys baileyi TaxID=28760 RepID=A0AAV9QUG3_9TELE
MGMLHPNLGPPNLVFTQGKGVLKISPSSCHKFFLMLRGIQTREFLCPKTFPHHSLYASSAANQATPPGPYDFARVGGCCGSDPGWAEAPGGPLLDCAGKTGQNFGPESESSLALNRPPPALLL